MKKKKPYQPPTIKQIVIDLRISLQQQSPSPAPPRPVSITPDGDAGSTIDGNPEHAEQNPYMENIRNLDLPEY